MRTLQLTVLHRKHLYYYISIFLQYTQSQDNSSWKGPQEVFSQTSPAQSRVSLRPGCSGLYQSSLGNLQGQRLHHLSGKQVSLPGCPHEEKGFPYTQYKHLVSAYTHCFSLSHHPSLYHTVLMISLHVQDRTGCFQASLLQLEQLQFPQPPLAGQVLQPLTMSLLNLLRFIDVCPVLEGGKTGQSIQDAAQRLLSVKALLFPFKCVFHSLYFDIQFPFLQLTLIYSYQQSSQD